MNNVVVLYKLDDGSIYCHQITEKGAAFLAADDTEDEGMWEEGGTITLDELEAILNYEIS